MTNKTDAVAVTTAREIGKAIQAEEIQKAKVAKAVAEYTCTLAARVKALSLSLTPFCYEGSTVVIIRGRDIKPLLIARKSAKGSGVIFEASYQGSKVQVTYTKVDGKKTAVEFNDDEREAQGVFDKLALNIKNSVNPLIASLASIAGTYDDVYSLAVAQESERNEAMARKLGLISKEN